MHAEGVEQWANCYYPGSQATSESTPYRAAPRVRRSRSVAPSCKIGVVIEQNDNDNDSDSDAVGGRSASASASARSGRQRE